MSAVTVELLHGLPVAAPADAWCQLAQLLGREDLVAAGDSLLASRRRPGLVTRELLVDAAARASGKRGAATLNWALPRLRIGVDSRRESLLRLLLVHHRLPEPLVGFPIDVGGMVFHPDLCYPELKVALEYEGDGHRVDPLTWRRDIHRYEALSAAGWLVIRVTAHDLSADQAGLIERVRRALASR